MESEITIDFLSDGTFIQSTEYISPGFEDESYIIRGEWTQRDNSILLQYDPESQPDSKDPKIIKSFFNGTIEGNIMRGQGIVLYEDIEFYDIWSASRISTEQSGGQ